MALSIWVALFAAATSNLLVQTPEVDTLKDALLVDTRPVDAFTAAHIPGAISLDVTSLSEKRDGVAGLLKPTDQVRKILGDAGIDPAKRIVLYSAMEKPDDLKDAARLFWILDYTGYPRIAVLDGGMSKWTAESRKTEQGAPKYTPITLPELKVRERLLATVHDVEARLQKQDGIVADLRGSDFYCGDKKADVVNAAGHIPGAINVPADAFVNEQSKTLKSWEDLKSIAQNGGISGASPVITYCNTGRTASTGYLVLRLLGYENVSMYDGSMSEWTASPERKVDTGPYKK